MGFCIVLFFSFNVANAETDFEHLRGKLKMRERGGRETEREKTPV